MNNLSFFKALLMKEMDEELKGGQKKLDVAEPKGKITKADFEKLRNKKGIKKEVDTPNPPTDYSGKPAIPGLGPIVGMKEGDHEVGMAHNSLESIIKSAMELKAKLGDDERNIPGWIQDHITNAENYIDQAAQGFHEIEGGESDMDELPVGDEEEPVADMSLQGMMEDLLEAKKKPSAGLSKKQKSAIVKKAKKGKDFGKKGKGFEKIVKAAKKSGAKDPEAVAGAAFWKGQAKKG